MHTFTDSRGRNFKIEITFASMKRVKAETGIDLGRPFAGNPPLLQRLGDDPLAIVEIAGTLVSGQNGLDPSKFIAESKPSDYPALRDALAAELSDFFREMGETDAPSLFALAKDTRAQAMAAAIAAHRRLTSGGSATNSPES